MSNIDYLPVPLYLNTLVCTDARYSTEMIDRKTQIYCKTMHGVNSELNFENSGNFKGDLNEGYATGKGEYRFEDGAVYSGYFDHNKATGQGKLTVASTSKCMYPSTYIGSFTRGLRDGYGKYELPLNGFVYEGEFKEGRIQGEAFVTYKNGSEYKGQVFNGLRHGKGKIVYKSGNYYEGQWREGVKEGQGSMYWLDRNEIVSFFYHSTRVNGKIISLKVGDVSTTFIKTEEIRI